LNATEPGDPVYFFRFDFGVFAINMQYALLIQPSGKNNEYWKSGVYRNGQIAFETDLNNSAPDRRHLVIRDFRPHSRVTDIYRKWFYLKNLILKSKKD
jgi:hypothetical protein